MLCLSLLFPVPAFDFKLSSLIIRVGQFCSRYLNWLPLGIQIIHHNLCPSCLNERVICSYLHELNIGITLIPKIKEGVGIEELFGSPVHLIED